MARGTTTNDDGLGARFLDLVRSPRGHVLIRALLASGVLLGVSLVMKEARAYSYGLQGYQVAPSRVKVVNIPAWLSSDAFHSEHPDQFSRFKVSVYDNDAEAIVKSHLLQHPLVRQVDEVRIRYPRFADARVSFRVPVARVRFPTTTRDGKPAVLERYLSDDGCLLPAEPYQRFVEHVGYPIPYVTGIRARPLPAVGKVWEDRHEQVAEAVAATRIAKMVYELFAGRVTVHAIDVSRFPASVSQRHDGEVRLRIICPPERRGGKRVVRTVEWGRTDRARSRVQGEDDTRTKLHRLRRLLTQPLPGGYLDVRDEPLMDAYRSTPSWR